MPECPNTDCGYPDTSCALRVEPGATCPQLGRIPLRGPNEEPSPDPMVPPATDQFWSGERLKPASAGPLFLSRMPIFILVAGLEGAGKSSLLARQYLAIGSGPAMGFDWRFCHSRTLRAWDSLGDSVLRWDGARAMVPPTSEAESAFLHLAFKPRVYPQSTVVLDRVIDVALTDIHGAAFDQWSENRDRGESLPLARVDTFWVVVDGNALSIGRTARSRAAELLDRVIEAAGHRPIALIVSNFDADRAQAPPERLTLALGKHRADHRVFFVPPRTTEAGDSPSLVLSPLAWSLAGLPQVPLSRRHWTPRTSRHFDYFRERIVT